MSLDSRFQVLDAVALSPCGIREVIQKLRWRASRVIYLSKKMSDEGLIELKQTKQPRRGKPKKNIVCTNLGLDFLKTCRQLKMKPIRARKADLERAEKDALYAERLISNGHSPFKLFMELNEIVSNIKGSSETP